VKKFIGTLPNSVDRAASDWIGTDLFLYHQQLSVLDRAGDGGLFGGGLHFTPLTRTVLGFFEEIILVLAFLLSLIGIGLTNYSPTNSIRFWMAMTVFMAVAAITIGLVKFVEHKKDIRADMIVTQLTHWGATLLAVLGVFLLLKAGRLNYDNTGLVLLLIIGLSTFLDGYRISWRFSLIGILVGGTAILAAFVEQFIWPVILLALILLTIAIFRERHRHQQARKMDGCP